MIFKAIDEVYFKHLILLVLGITLLNGTSVSEDTEENHKALTKYVKRNCFLYGLKNMTSN